MEAIEQQRRDMVAASYSNPNWDGKDNASKREEYLRELNRHFNDAITAIYYPKEREQEVDWNNPFFAAHRREMERTKERFSEILGHDIGDKTAGEVLEAEQNGAGRHDDIDQIPRNQ